MKLEDWPRLELDIWWQRLHELPSMAALLSALDVFVKPEFNIEDVVPSAVAWVLAMGIWHTAHVLSMVESRAGKSFTSEAVSAIK